MYLIRMSICMFADSKHVPHLLCRDAFIGRYSACKNVELANS